ncbi:MAG: ATP-binding cassette domain-containing protein, partial [Kurthia sp.]|nr:ATP-binding cassette domain-containing protein [Kurthia sp.]
PEKVEQILKDFSLEKIQHDDARLLSGGQKRRVSLAIGAAMRPEIMLLDEPTANLDIATKRHVIQMLNSLKEHVKTVMIASHDMQLVSEWATRILVMHEGKVIGDGTREEIFSNPSLLEKAGLVMPQIMKLSQKMNLETPSYTIEDFCENFICLESDGVKHEYV